MIAKEFAKEVIKMFGDAIKNERQISLEISGDFGLWDGFLRVGVGDFVTRSRACVNLWMCDTEEG